GPAGRAGGDEGAQSEPQPDCSHSPAAAATASETTTPTAADKAAAATSESAAAAATPAAAATTTPAAARELNPTTTDAFPIEQMECGETDVGHFLFAKNDALIGRVIVGSWNIRSGHGGRGCATEQRKTQSGGSQRLHGSGLRCAFGLRSLLDPWHGRHPPTHT